jgi:hypothetical protein
MKHIYDIAFIRKQGTIVFGDSFGERELAEKVAKYFSHDKNYRDARVEVVERDLIEDMSDMFRILMSGEK